MPILPTNSIIFKHMIDPPKAAVGSFVTRRKNFGGTTRLFLFLKIKGASFSQRVARHLGRNGASQESAYILETYSKAIAEQKIPWFVTSVRKN